MSKEHGNESFAYTYSAKQQEEIRTIRAKYAPKAEDSVADKMETLRRLDAGVTRKGNVVSLMVGIVSALILGMGMCCCLVWDEIMFIPGIIIGVLGIVGIALAYPVYSYIIRKERERIAPEILRLTDELMK